MSAYTCLFTRLQGVQPSYLTLVARKRFIQTRDAGVAFNPPQVIVNNPGQFVYPGGRVTDGNFFAGALREFREETGVNFVLSPDGRRITFGLYALPFHLDANAAGFSCLYVRVGTEADLDFFANTVNTNINANDPAVTISDELYNAGVAQLQSYRTRRPTAAIGNYCNLWQATLSQANTKNDWIRILNDGAVPVPPQGVMPVPNPVPTTEDTPGTPYQQGVPFFTEECYDMGPFMDFIRGGGNWVFPDSRAGRVYSFMRANEALPSRFSTDWFSIISQQIPAMDAIVPAV